MVINFPYWLNGVFKANYIIVVNLFFFCFDSWNGWQWIRNLDLKLYVTFILHDKNDKKQNDNFFCAKDHTFAIKYIKLLNLITLRFLPFVLCNIIISKYRIICILRYLYTIVDTAERVGEVKINQIRETGMIPFF